MIGGGVSIIERQALVGGGIIYQALTAGAGFLCGLGTIVGFRRMALSVGLTVVLLTSGGGTAFSAQPDGPPDAVVKQPSHQAPPPPAVPVPTATGSPAEMQARFDAQGVQRDQKGSAPLSDIGKDNSTLDISKAPRIPNPVSRPAKLASVHVSEGTGDLDDAAGTPAVSAGGVVAVKLPKRKGAAKARVKVSVSDEVATEALGGQKVSFTLDRTDNGATDEDVEVAVNYDSFRDANGSDWASRLRVVQLPACQGQKGCADPATVVPSSNDTANGVVTARVPLKAKAKPAAGVAPAGLAAPTGGLVTFALSAGTNGSVGDWAATPLLNSSQWGVAENTGAFTWSYPLTPVPATGPAPSVSLAYNSQSVDGMTAGTNNQGGLVGPGWDLLGGGFIERAYRPCGTDNVKPPTADPSELCWAGMNVGAGYEGLSINLNGQSSPLIARVSPLPLPPNPPIYSPPIDYVLKSDPLWQVRDSTTSAWGAPGNGGPLADNDGEHFTVLTPDGWVYEFGSDPINRKSVWAVPVIGNDSTEPCAANVGAAKQCYQAWRWNLDKVTDPYGNTMVYTYDAAQNQYLSNFAGNGAQSPVWYTRGGWLARIDYGYPKLASLSTPGPASMVFTYQNRCAPSYTMADNPPRPFADDPSAACDAILPEPSSPPNSYPDIPMDLVCRPGLICSTSATAPSFFQTKRLASIATFAGGAPVDSWSLYHQWVKPDEDVGWKLWVRTIQRTTAINTGPLTTSAQSVLPSVYFDSKPGVPQANRVDTTGNPLMKYYRVELVTNEFGSRTEVTYGTPHAAGQPAGTVYCNLAEMLNADPLKPEDTMLSFDYQNLGHDCYRQRYTPAGGTSPIVGVFYKYFVTDVRETDPVAGNPTVHTSYVYGNPAWHRADTDIVTPDSPSKLEYNLFRGSDWVETTVGDGATKTKTATWFYQGMDYDGCPNRPTFSAASPKSGCTVPNTDIGRRVVTYAPPPGWTMPNVPTDIDDKGMNGLVRHTAQRDSSGNDLVRAHYSYIQQFVVDNGYQTAKRVLQNKAQTWQNTWGAWPEQETDTHRNFSGIADVIVEKGFVSDPTDDRCTQTTFAANITMATFSTTASGPGLVAYRPTSVKLTDGTLTESGVAPFSGSCAGGTQFTQTDIAYDSGNQPNKVTRYSGPGLISDIVYTSYDTLGRVISQSVPSTATTAPVAATVTAYTPAAGGLITGITVTDPTTHITTTTIDPTRGVPTVIVDNQTGGTTTTQVAYDGIGRTTGVLLPQITGGPVPSWATPNYRFSYSIPQAPALGGGSGAYTTSERLQSPGVYNFTRTFLDGLGRSRETQGRSPTIGKVDLSYSRYNDRGTLEKQTQPFSLTAPDPTLATASPLTNGAALASTYGNVVASTKQYDSLGRVTSDQAWSDQNLVSTTNYVDSGPYHQVFPQLGSPTYQHVNAYGKMDQNATIEQGCCTGDIAVAHRQNDLMVMFGIGAEGDLFRKDEQTRNGYWNDWTRVMPTATGQAFTRVAATVRPDGRLAVAATQADGHVFVYAEQTINSNNFVLVLSSANGAGCCIGASTGATDISLTADNTGNLWVFGINGVLQAFQIKETAPSVWGAWSAVSDAPPGVGRIAATRTNAGLVAVAVTVAGTANVFIARQTVIGGALSPMSGALAGIVGTDIDLDSNSASGNLALVAVAAASGIVNQRSETSLGVWTSWVPIGNSNTVNVAVERHNDYTLSAAVGYTAGAWVNGSTQGTVQTAYETSPGNYTLWTPANIYRQTTYSYDKRDGLTAVTDPMGNTTTYAHDWLGRVTSNHDPDKSSTVTSATTTTYQLDATGLANQVVVDPVGNRVQTNLDLLGRPTTRRKLTTTGTVAASLATWTYDTALFGKGRLASTSACDGLTTTCTAPITTSVGGYDQRGRVTGKTVTGDVPVTAGSNIYTWAYGYDDADHPTTISYPTQTGAETVTNAYDQDGRATTVKNLVAPQTYVAGSAYWDTGQLANRNLGATALDTMGVTRWYNYDNLNRTRELLAVRPGAPVWNLQWDRYSYDAVGNVTNIDHIEQDGGTAQNTECFRYDDRQRLTAAWSTNAFPSGPGSPAPCVLNQTGFKTMPTPHGTDSQVRTVYGVGSAVGGTDLYGKVYNYDAAGNMTFMGPVGVGQTGGGNDPGSISYPAPGGVQPHAAIGTTGKLGNTYDANGSMKTRGLDATTKQCLFWNAENRLDSISTATTAACTTGASLAAGASGERNRYNADGQRIKRVVVSGTVTTTTLYLDGLAEITTTVTGTTLTGTSISKFYRAGNAAVAMRKDGVITWLLEDAQGGVAVSVPNATDGTVANQTGMQRQRYLPYGQRRGTTPGRADTNPNDRITATDHGFLGQVEDGTTGLSYLNNRYLDPTLGRFVSVDPIVDVTRDAYGYGNNNPITRSDPTGLCAPDDGGGARQRCIDKEIAVPRGSGGPGSGDTISGGGGGSAPVLDALSVGDASKNLAIASGKKAGQDLLRSVDFANHGDSGYYFGEPDVQRATVEFVKALAAQTARKVMQLSHFGRRPDYFVVEVALFSHVAAGGGSFVTFSRDGDVYFTPLEVGIGTEGLAITGRAGWLNQKASPSKDELASFLGGKSVTASGNLTPGLPAAAITYGFSGVGTELGITYFGQPGASLTVSYAWVDHGGGWAWNG
jgi:RHS repeat-associated protein